MTLDIIMHISIERTGSHNHAHTTTHTHSPKHTDTHTHILSMTFNEPRISFRDIIWVSASWNVDLAWSKCDVSDLAWAATYLI